MKLMGTCFQCMEAKGVNYFPQMVRLAPKDSGLYEFICSDGHLNSAVLQQRHFQLLFEMGLYALKDGYPREAVADFAASLERFYEFYFKFTCRLSKVPDKDVDETWRLVAAQSERQLGLYLSAYLAANGTTAPTLSNPQTKFRNDVIHKGNIPLYSEAIAFGEAVRNLIQPIIRRLAVDHAKALMEDTGLHLIRQSRERTPVATISYPTTLSFEAAEDIPLEERIQEIGVAPWS